MEILPKQGEKITRPDITTNNFDKDGYDVNLRANIKVGQPAVFDINSININPNLKDCLMGQDIKEAPFLWGLEDAPNNFEKI